MTTTKYAERKPYHGELEINVNSEGLVSIEVTDSDYDSDTFLVERFDQSMIALDILGPGDTDQLPVPPSDVSDDVLVNIARGALTALRERRAAAARQEEGRKEEIAAIAERLEGQPLSLTQPLGPQLHALGFRLVAGGAA